MFLIKPNILTLEIGRRNTYTKWFWGLFLPQRLLLLLYIQGDNNDAFHPSGVKKDPNSHF